jgi:hypothetical protein
MIKYITMMLLFFSFTAGWSTTETLERHSMPPAPYPSWQEVIQYADETLPLEGQLVAKTDGFTYLKVDNAYIHTLFPMLGLKEEGYREPPYFRRPNSPGAHISVFYENEHIKPEEIGQTFHFKPKNIVIVKASNRVSYAILQVESPELEQLREKYGLSPKLQGHEFHITLGKKVAPFKTYRGRN